MFRACSVSVKELGGNDARLADIGGAVTFSVVGRLLVSWHVGRQTWKHSVDGIGAYCTGLSSVQNGDMDRLCVYTLISEACCDEHRVVHVCF